MLIQLGLLYILKGKDGSEIKGCGKPVACAGYLKIKGGKITYISNESGHYQPKTEQLQVAAKFLKSQEVLDEKGILEFWGFENKTQLFFDLDKIVLGEILDQYPEVNY